MLTQAFSVERFIAAVEDVLREAPRPVVLHEPEFGERERTLVTECLDSGWVSSAGPHVARFERMVAEAAGVAHAVAIVNGTAALHAALMVAGVRAGDEVIVPAVTFVATANAVSHSGAVPHFVDSEPASLGIDSAALAAHLDEIGLRRDGALHNCRTGRRIAAVVPVHVFGHPVDVDALMAVAREHGLPVIEDATEALGSTYRGRPAGSFGKAGILSFNGNKIITTGGGGMIVTDDADFASQARHLTTTAKKPHAWAFDHDMVGYNYRMPNLNAALGCAQMERLTEAVAEKRALADRYAEALAPIAGIAFLRERLEARCNYWLNAVLLAPGHADLRDLLLGRLHDQGILARPLWTPMHMLPMYAGCPRAALPVAEDVFRRIINLPSSSRLGRRPGR